MIENKHKKWNSETVKEVALLCSTRTEFRLKYYAAWKFCQKKDLFNEYCSHMLVLRKKYSKSECKQEALKYNNRTDFNKKSKKYYTHAIRNGWLDEICSHMTLGCTRWTKEDCLNFALLCTYRKEFYKKYKKFYEQALNHGWLEEICSHMIITGSRYKRCVYVWEFEDNHAYIGLTCNINNRTIQHKTNKKSQVFKHLINSIGFCKQLTDYVDIKNAKLLEMDWIIKYKNNGWNILNKTTGGETGGSVEKWNYHNTIETSKKCKNRSKFKKLYSGAYKYAKKNNMLNILYPI